MMARPVRTCVGCRQRFAIESLVRITIDTRGQLVVGGSSDGRGVWLCAGTQECALRAERSGALGRGFRATVAPERVRALIEMLSDKRERSNCSGRPGTVVS